MPRPDQLPASLAKLVRRNALELSPSRFEFDTGRLLEVLAPKVEQAIGVDQSREMLALARANLARAGIDNAEIRRANM